MVFYFVRTNLREFYVEASSIGSAIESAMLLCIDKIEWIVVVEASSVTYGGGGMISLRDASAEALAKGGSFEEIDRQAYHYVRQVGTVPFNNMIRALNMHPWLNDCAQWTRLAAALTARKYARKGK